MNQLRTIGGERSLNEQLTWKRLGMGVIIGFTLKGMIATALMLMLMNDFVFH